MKKTTALFLGLPVISLVTVLFCVSQVIIILNLDVIREKDLEGSVATFLTIFTFVVVVGWLFWAISAYNINERTNLFQTYFFLVMVASTVFLFGIVALAFSRPDYIREVNSEAGVIIMLLVTTVMTAVGWLGWIGWIETYNKKK